MAKELVLTPGGYRPRSLVQQVEPGQVVRLSCRRLGPPPGGTLDLPWGMGPAGAANLAPGRYWVANAYWRNETGNPITFFRATWRVPPAPGTLSDQTLFLFSGLVRFDASGGILQPVLQWGESAAGGGHYWSVSSWYAAYSGEVRKSAAVRVEEGATLTGLMMLTGQSGDAFTYHCEFQGVGGTGLDVADIPELLLCYAVLEVQDVNQCTDYPLTDRTTLADIHVRTSAGTPVLAWFAENRVTDCGQRAVPVNDSAEGGQIDIIYRT